MLAQFLQSCGLRCTRLSSLTIPSSLVIPGGFGWLSNYKSIECLELSGCLDNHPDLFSIVEFSPDAFPALRQLRVEGEVAETIINLWSTPIVTNLTKAIIRMSRLDNDNAALLASVIAERSPRLNSLSIPLPPEPWTGLLLDKLSTLSLRMLALDLCTETSPSEFHPTVLQYIGSLWPALEFLSVPFGVEFNDLLNVFRWMPLLRHLAAYVYMELIEDYAQTFTPLSWDSPPNHPLFLWTSFEPKFFSEDEVNSQRFDKLARFLASTWPFMKLMVKRERRVSSEHLGKEIAEYSLGLLQDKALYVESEFETRGILNRNLLTVVTSGSKGVLTPFS
ncbi:hypothetical protein RhiLY_00333 [Ceratobasidium sp. AG-Ba]|nr:hypothetical protein RhiLY_00333 [Ceratobasidium sp. AG-Ba]